VDTQALWRRYRVSRDPRLRDELIMVLTPLVRYLVYRKGRALPARCDLDDLTSAGFEALVWAVDHYQSERGATLQQFAWTRVRGAILDELRRQDWAPRSLRRSERAHARALAELSAELGRRPTDEELAERLELTPGELRELRDDIGRADIASLNETVRRDAGEEDIERVDTLSDRRWEPAAIAVKTAACRRVREALATMPEREQRIAELLYTADMSQREVSTLFDVTESRISQIHSDLRRRLRAALDEDRDLFDDVS
jgi:RNA polymerase sigma factor for flagellar operon FliA